MTHTLIVTVVLSLMAAPAWAQARAEGAAPIDPVAFRASIANASFDNPDASRVTLSRQQAAGTSDKMGTGWRVLVTALAGMGGFYAGGAIGARIEGPCGGCDDPGFKGAIIGAPIGAAAAAITTWILSGK